MKKPHLVIFLTNGPWVADFLLSLVRSTNFMRLSLKSSTDVADPRDMKRGISCPRQKVQQIPGCPILCAFRKGWDTTNLDTDRRVSHPLPRAQRMGHPPIRGASCVPNTNCGLIENFETHI